jgi:hypothetical protein
MSTQPFSLSVGPGTVTATVTATPAKVTTHTTVADLGSLPLHITTSTLLLSTSGKPGPCNAKAPHWLTVTPATFNLKPGQSKTVTVTISMPKTAHGTVSLGAQFIGQRPQNTHVQGASINGAVAEKITVHAPGSATSCAASLGHPPAKPLPVADIAGAGLAAALLATLLAVVIRRRRNRRQSAEG